MEWLLIALAIAAGLYAWRWRRRQDVPVGDGPGDPVVAEYEVKCGSELAIPNAPQGRVRLEFEVLAHCGNGVVIEGQQPNGDWVGLVPMRLGESQEVRPVLHGRAVFVGDQPMPMRIRCQPGPLEHGCRVRVTMRTEARDHDPRDIVFEDTARARCGQVVFIGTVKGARTHIHEAEITVRSDCGAGVTVFRHNTVMGDVPISGAPAGQGDSFEVRSGQTARVRLQARPNQDNVYFRVTCNTGGTGNECQVQVRITKVRAA